MRSHLTASQNARRVVGALTALIVLLAAGACVAPSGGTVGRGAKGVITVVAAENFWGSVARQLGGSRVALTSIITNPNTDPHDYEPTVEDARTIATARFVLYNGVGYDPWVQKLLAAAPDSSRVVLNVGSVVGVSLGGNPHRWYSPADVHAVIAEITADYKRMDPADAAYFDAQRKRYETVSLAEYDRLIAAIRSRYGGTPIGASESIVTPLAQALGLRMLTPESFLDAISEGIDPSAADKATIDEQIRTHRIRVFVYNRQNATPDVAALVNEAKAAGIPVVTVTETMVPASGTFQDWQTGELRSIEQALKSATGR